MAATALVAVGWVMPSAAAASLKPRAPDDANEHLKDVDAILYTQHRRDCAERASE